MIDIVKQISSIGKIADKFIQTKEEKNAFHKEMTQILIQAEADQQKNVTERWKHDMSSDNMLTKSVRPMVLIFLVVSTVLMIRSGRGALMKVRKSPKTELL